MLGRILGRGVEEASEATEAEEAESRARVGMVVDMADSTWIGGFIPASEQPRYPYRRPEWLYLIGEDELAVSGDQATRPVLTPKDPRGMPLCAGYAETINGGKTPLNEDQASAKVLHLVEQTYEEDGTSGKGAPTPCPGRKFAAKATSNSDEDETSEEEKEATPTFDDQPLSLASPTVPGSQAGSHSMGWLEEEYPRREAQLIRVDAYYFGLFDGHAGTGAAIMASNCLHEHIRERLSQVLGTLVHLEAQEAALGNSAPILTPNGKRLTRDGLVIGALETAFVEMDDQIAEEKMLWRIPGGCAALVGLAVLGRLYVANAGDCRALLVHGKHLYTLSHDLTPDNERKRLQLLINWIRIEDVTVFSTAQIQDDTATRHFDVSQVYDNHFETPPD